MSRVPETSPFTSLLEGKKGSRIWPSMRLRDRIDAIIPHEYDELHHQGSHADALKAAAKTELPISDEARRLNRAGAPLGRCSCRAHDFKSLSITPIRPAVD